MNKYLVKISEMSDENKQVAHTFASSWLPSIPADIAGGLAGGHLARNMAGVNLPKLGMLGRFAGHHIPGSSLGAIAGASLLSGATELIGIKHSLHNKVPPAQPVPQQKVNESGAMIA